MLRKYATGHVTAREFYLQPVTVIFGKIQEGKEFFRPGKTLRVAIRAGEDGNKYQALYFFFQGTVHIVRFVEPVMGVYVKVDGNIFLENAFKFILQGLDEIRDPAVATRSREIVLLAVRDEDVVLVAG